MISTVSISGYSWPTSFPVFSVRDSLTGTEEIIVRWWSQLKPGTVLTDRNGYRILVIRTGVRNRKEGPDFQGARFFYRDQFLDGDVECHRLARDWFAHGHRQNRAYHQVKLHLLGAPTKSDQNLPGVIVYFPGYFAMPFSCSLTLDNLSVNWAQVLKKFSQKRWQEKVRYFRCSVNSGSKVLLTTAFRLLGKGGNEIQFLQLAEMAVQQPVEHLSLPELTRHLNKWGGQLVWKRGGIRPRHHPHNRFPLAAALVHFINQFDSTWWNQTEKFEKAFKDRFTSLGGTGILTELIGNVFYPYLAAESLNRGNTVCYREWNRRFASLELPYSYGKYCRRFKSLLGNQTLNSFPVLQGLLELDKQFCAHGHCGLCPLKDWHGHLE